MKYELPHAVKHSLSMKESRLHHILWHAIRDSWHDFTETEKQTMRDTHPGWVPNNPRFKRVQATAENPNGIEINYDAGESFLYMHRRMIQGVNVQLLALGEPALIPWPSVPELDDPFYPVPNRDFNGPADNPKSDSHYSVMADRARQARDTQALKNNSLSTIGAFIESAIHDFMHGRWADEPGVMSDFPDFSPTNVNPLIDEKYNSPEVDWLGHPYSSHVNSTFWRLHGWVDETIDHWRIANDLERIEWNDTWSGDFPEDAQPKFTSAPSSQNPIENLEKVHNHFSHGHHGWENMFEVFRTINTFKNCHSTFSYVQEKSIPIQPLVP